MRDLYKQKLPVIGIHVREVLNILINKCVEDDMVYCYIDGCASTRYVGMKKKEKEDRLEKRPFFCPSTVSMFNYFINL